MENLDPKAFSMVLTGKGATEMLPSSQQSECGLSGRDREDLDYLIEAAARGSTDTPIPEPEQWRPPQSGVRQHPGPG